VSREDVENHRRIYEAFNRADMDEFISYCDPDIEFHSLFEAVAGVYRGREGIRRWRNDLDDAWGTEMRVEPQAFFDLGDQTLALFVVRARGRQSRVDVEMPNAQVAKWRDGRCAYLKTFATKAEALAELGASEDEIKALDTD
jgi:ketosteroid isomerase-like protein